jgi:hypothetical protein
MCLMPETWVNYQRRRVENASLMTNLRRRIFYASSLRGVKGDMFLPTRVSNDSPQMRHLLSTRVTYVSHWRRLFATHVSSERVIGDAYWQPASPLMNKKKPTDFTNGSLLIFYTCLFTNSRPKKSEITTHVSKHISRG